MTELTAITDAAAYAAVVRPAIDRIHAGLHAASRDRARPVVERYGLRVGSLVDLRFALLARPLTPAGFAAVMRYRSPEQREEEIETQVEQGALAEDADGVLHMTPRTEKLLRALYAIHAEVAEELWESAAARISPPTVARPTVTRLAALVGRLLDAAADTGGPAFAQMSPPYEPADAPAGLLLFNRLAALRYHRADAHAAAWQAAGLTAPEIMEMPAGPARDAIEADTNRRDATPYTALTPAERVEFLAGLAALPG